MTEACSTFTDLDRLGVRVLLKPGLVGERCSSLRLRIIYWMRARLGHKSRNFQILDLRLSELSISFSLLPALHCKHEYSRSFFPPPGAVHLLERQLTVRSETSQKLSGSGVAPFCISLCRRVLGPTPQTRVPSRLLSSPGSPSPPVPPRPFRVLVSPRLLVASFHTFRTFSQPDILHSSLN